MNDAHYAVVVGINRYPGISDLSGARADAESFCGWLVDPDGGGLPARNVEKVWAARRDEARFRSADRARPVADDIDSALKRASEGLRRQLDADPNLWDESRLYLYAAGHGFAPQAAEGALFLANAEMDVLGRSIELSEYRKWCTSCALFREVVVFADCCRTRMQSAPPALGPRLNPCAHPWNGKKSTYLIGFGANLGNPTYELPAAGTDDEARGYFTSALVEGLRGAAPRDRHGALTAKNLASYVKTVVAARTADQPFPQQADIVGALDADIVFGAAEAPPKRKVTLVLPARFAGIATLVKDGRDLDSHEGGGEWELELEDGLYEVVAGRRRLKNDGLFKVAGKGRRVPL